MFVWICWLLSLTIVTYASVQIVRRYPQYGFAALTGFYVVYLAASQIVAARVVDFDLGFYVFTAPAAVLLYPFIAQVTDMINEVYGKAMTHAAIAIVFISQLLLVIFFLMVNSLTPAAVFTHENAWQDIFSMSIRITLASWVAFLVCSTIDAHIFSTLKQRFLQRELSFRHHTMVNPYVWLRSSVSDAVSLTLDSIIFVTIAFLGVLPILPLMLGQIVIKNIIGFIDNPWFVWYKHMLKKGDKEGEPGQGSAS